MRWLAILVLAFAGTPATSDTRNESVESSRPEFDVIEFRRYTIKPSEREAFATYFEAYFPEAFQQLGAIAFGQFLERDNDAMFTWLRGFSDMDARKDVNTAFYYGPLWKEHRTTMNDLLIDSDNVLLLTPLDPDRGITLMPAVDIVEEVRGAQGIIVAQIFSVAPSRVEALAKDAEESFARYRAAGAREAGVLVTLDAQNNFPQLPVRTDGPYLVWLGVLENDKALEKFRSLAKESLSHLSKTGMLRNDPELVVMDPTHRSRLRWLAGEMNFPATHI